MVETSMYIATHKEFNKPKNDMYKPILVGSVNSSLELKDKYILDELGENISSKNPFYCELTALYWIWKNTSEDRIGLCHYRRYFFKRSSMISINGILNKKDIDHILSKYDFILPKKMYFYKKNVKEQFLLKHDEKVLIYCRDIIKLNFPKFMDAFDIVFSNHYLYCYNMFITSKENLDLYCDWLFVICFELEKKLMLTNNYENNKRIIGYMSERLLNVWIVGNKSLKIKEMPVYNTESGHVKYEIENQVKRVINNITFFNK